MGLGLACGCRRLPLSLLQTIENQFHTCRNPDLVKNPEEIIPHDLLLARGLSPRRVVLACYGITATLVVIARLGMRGSAAEVLLVSGLGLAVLLLGALWLGALREEHKECHVPRVRRMEEKYEKF